MSGPGSAALALAAAVLLGVSPRRRLASGTGRRRDRRPGRRGWIGAAALACVAVPAVAVLPTGGWLAAAVLGGTTAWRRQRSLRRRRALAETRALQAALDVLTGELRVGAHPVRAFATAAVESGHPAVAAGLRGVCARAGLGADVASGLREAARGSAWPAPWERLAVYWELGGEHGLAIATLMQAAQLDITARQRFSARADAGMAGARASATLLGLLPVLGVLLGQLIGAHPLVFLAGDFGGVLALVGVSLICAGLLWSDRITTVGGSP